MSAKGKEQPATELRPSLARRAGRALGLDGHVARNSLLLVGANSAGKVFAFALNALIVWALGDERFGEFRAAIAYVGVFANGVELGLLRPGARAVAKAPERAGDVFAAILKTKAILALLTGAVFVAATLYGFADPLFRTLAGLWFLVALAHGAKRACDCVFMGLQRMGYTAAFLFANRLGTLLLSALFLYFSHSIVGLFLLFLAIEATETAAQFVLARRLARAAREVPPSDFAPSVDNAPIPSTVGGWIREGLPFGAHEMALEISFRIDSVMLYAGISAGAVAFYNKAYLILTSVLMLPGALCQATFPALVSLRQRDPSLATEHFRRSLPLFVLAGPFLAATLIALKEPVLWALKGNAEHFPLYALSMATLVVFFLTIPLSYYLGVIHRQNQLAAIAGLCAAFNVALNLRLIPVHEAMGAAYATLATELFALALAIRCLLPGGGARLFDLPRLFGFAAAHAAILSLGWPWLNGGAGERVAFLFLYGSLIALLGLRQRRMIRQIGGAP